MQEADQIERPLSGLSPFRGKWLPVAVRSLISLGLIAGSVAAFISLGSGRLAVTKDVGKPPLQVVEVVRAMEHGEGIDFEVDGVVIPFRQIEVPSEVAGRVSYKSDNCRVGHTVQQDELLLKIDPQDYQLEIRRLEQDLKQAQANLHELDVETASRRRQIDLAQEDLQIKKREVARYENIEDPGVYSKSEMDSVRLKELQARDALQTEHDQLELLQAKQDRFKSACDLVDTQLEKARLDLARTEIRAPIDGVITHESVEQGGYVQRGGTVVMVQDTSRMEIRCSLHMHQMHWIWRSVPQKEQSEPSSSPGNGYHLPETPVTVTFNIGTTKCTWRGQLAYFDSAQVDQQTRMVPCRVTIRDPQSVKFEGEASEAALRGAPITLMAGMFVTVEVHARPALSLVRLPDVAVQPGNVVWMVRTEGKKVSGTGRLARAEIEVAHSDRDTVLAYAHGSALSPGDLVVISPLASPTEDTLVEIREVP